MFTTLHYIVFQFPSSGKLLPNFDPTPKEEVTKPGFNSLQAGNSYQTIMGVIPHLQGGKKFQFPSSGKLLPNTTKGEAEVFIERPVSIPFKRETPTKQYWRTDTICDRSNSFNSLQAGNSYQTTKMETNFWHINLFQFPSSGKLLPNRHAGHNHV